jgi:hypothetical protein
MLGRQRMASGLDAIGLADLLSSQRRKIADSIPQGLADQMSASGLGDALRDRPRMAATTTTGPGPTAAQRVSRQAGTTTTTTRPTQRRASNSWLYWLLGLAALAAIAFYAIGNRAEREVTPTTTGAVTDPFTVGGVNVRDEVTASMDNVQMTLSGITDEASARAALPVLRTATTQLENAGSLARQLPPESRSQIADTVSNSLPAVEREFDRLLAMPGVDNVVRPAIEGLRSRMQSLASA